MNLLFAGASGYGNVGDDAYRVVFSKWFGEKHNVRFESPYPDIDAVKESDVLTIGGGGLLYATPISHYDYMSAYLDAAYTSGIPTCFLSCGIQGILREELNNPEKIDLTPFEIWAPHLKRAKLITVRSRMCVRLIKRIIGDHPNIQYAPDAAYSTPTSPYRIGPNNAVVVIPTLGSLKHPDFPRVLSTIGSDERVVVASFSRDDDETVKEVAAKFTGHGNFVDRLRLSVQDAMAILGGAKRVITSRYHGAVLARAAGIKISNIEILDRRYKAIVEEDPQSPKESELNKQLFESSMLDSTQL